MFSLRLCENQSPFSLANIAFVMDVGGKLKARHEYAPEKFVETMKLMEHRYEAKEFVMSKEGILELLAPRTYYLKEVDSLYRRFYGKKGDDGSTTPCSAPHNSSTHSSPVHSSYVHTPLVHNSPKHALPVHNSHVHTSSVHNTPVHNTTVHIIPEHTSPSMIPLQIHHHSCELRLLPDLLSFCSSGD